MENRIVDKFLPVVPELKLEQIEYAYKIALKPRDKDPGTEGAAEESIQADDEAPELEAPVDATKNKSGPSYIVVVRFTTKQLRNKVFFKSKKHKFTPKLILRNDLIKADYDVWVKAKPQMSIAHDAGKRSRCNDGQLKINGQKIPVDGVETEASIMANAQEEGTLHVPYKLKFNFTGAPVQQL